MIHWIENVITSLPLRERGVVFNLFGDILVICIGITKVRTSINTPYMYFSQTWNKHSFEFILFKRCLCELSYPTKRECAANIPRVRLWLFIIVLLFSIKSVSCMDYETIGPKCSALHPTLNLRELSEDLIVGSLKSVKYCF